VNTTNRINDADGDGYIEISDKDSNVDITFNTGGDSFINTGSVGIGTASPKQTLNVVGDGNFTGNLWIDGKTNVSVWMYNQTYAGGTYNVTLCWD